MSELQDLQRRITAALERIGQGVGRLSAGGDGAGDGPGDAALAELREALEAERNANAQLNERLRAVKERDAHSAQQMEIRIEAMTRQLDVQGLELQRMRKTTIQLREQLRILREAADAGSVDAHLINKSMLAEMEALRAVRASETAELDEILAELQPLVEEVAHHA